VIKSGRAQSKKPSLGRSGAAHDPAAEPGDVDVLLQMHQIIGIVFDQLQVLEEDAQQNMKDAGIGYIAVVQQNHSFDSHLNHYNLPVVAICKALRPHEP